MDTLFEIDRSLAETLLGRLPGRPTISWRVGGFIGRTFGISTQAGTALFHGTLIGLGIVAAASYVGSKK